MSDLFMTPNEVALADVEDGTQLIIPASFQDALSYAQQIIWLYLHKQDKLVSGENITLTENPDGTVTISAEGGGAEARGIKSITGTVGPTGTTVTVTLTDDSTQTFFVERGPEGPQGEQGPTGPVGPQGIQGPAGETGPAGATGPQGPQGIQGEQGPAGTTGPQGETGPAGPQGPQGVPGQDGADGTDGVSPTIAITFITGGTRVSVTDAQGTQSFDVMDGAEGQQGPQGPAGPTGPQGPQGVQGVPGADGTDGTDGTDGVSPEVTIASITGGHSVTITDADHPSGQTFNVMDGVDGTDGTNGTDGTDGVSPEVTIASITGGHRVTITDEDHPLGQSFDVMDGTDGQNGTNGTNGTDGVSPEVTIASITGGHSVTITDADHPSGQTFNVMDGQDGATGATGATGPQGPAGPGVPSGGTDGQVLTKDGSTDYATKWATPQSGGGVDKIAIPWKSGTLVDSYGISCTLSNAGIKGNIFLDGTDVISNTLLFEQISLKASSQTYGPGYIDIDFDVTGITFPSGLEDIGIGTGFVGYTNLNSSSMHFEVTGNVIYRLTYISSTNKIRLHIGFSPIKGMDIVPQGATGSNYTYYIKFGSWSYDY